MELLVLPARTPLRSRPIRSRSQEPSSVTITRPCPKPVGWRLRTPTTSPPRASVVGWMGNCAVELWSTDHRRILDLFATSAPGRVRAEQTKSSRRHARSIARIVVGLVLRDNGAGGPTILHCRDLPLTPDVLLESWLVSCCVTTEPAVRQYSIAVTCLLLPMYCSNRGWSRVT